MITKHQMKINWQQVIVGRLFQAQIITQITHTTNNADYLIQKIFLKKIQLDTQINNQRHR